MLMLYSATQPSNLEKILSENYFMRAQSNPVQISKHGDVFVVEHGKTTVYLPDGSFFVFEENSKITESFAPSLQNPTKTFDLALHIFTIENTANASLHIDPLSQHLLFSQSPPPKFKIINASSCDKRLGCFFVCSSLKERNIIKSIIKDCEFVEIGKDSEDIYWNIIKMIN
ncbi:uncharacterized protein VICG_00745 [Vittaforma corneae ATCC 50505]|uniref:Uncharacterized protein n=1 Tax=Vittaforma corneae (strain ATCC 50505) TaxID=993615 RepID=L2GNC8_VITCO|nr:uncharacterized protein VICG_00745 [Vittaforma corneae ATCC 50505]ELA42104.1 hypothetical protein VICG_00745 [Vittaforma corneae ATCC 50505]